MRASGLFGKVEHDGVSCSPMLEQFEHCGVRIAALGALCLTQVWEYSRVYMNRSYKLQPRCHHCSWSHGLGQHPLETHLLQCRKLLAPNAARPALAPWLMLEHANLLLCGLAHLRAFLQRERADSTLLQQRVGLCAASLVYSLNGDFAL